MNILQSKTDGNVDIWFLLDCVFLEKGCVYAIQKQPILLLDIIGSLLLLASLGE